MKPGELTWKDVQHIWWMANTILQSIPDDPAAWPEWAMSTEGRFTHILNELHYERNK